MSRCVLGCLVVWLVACVAVACAEPAAPQGPFITSRVVRKEALLPRRAALDVLFVVDSSPAMAAHRQTLVANATRFIDMLETNGGGLPDLHLGVVTTDVGTRGALDASSTAHGDGSW